MVDWNKYRIISESQRANRLLEGIGLPDNIIKHSKQVAIKAVELYEPVIESVEMLETVRLSALPHDIGKAMPGMHEINTQALLSANRFQRLTPYTMHGFVFESFNSKGIDIAERFQDIKNRYSDNKPFLAIVAKAQIRIENPIKNISIMLISLKISLTKRLLWP